MNRRTAVLAAALVAATAGAAGAQSLQNVEIHGFGTWAYGRTNNDNEYLGGIRQGNYGSGTFDLNIGVTLTDRFRLRLQPFWDYENLSDETTSGMAYAFAEYSITPNLAFRVGQVKQPFGIYTEIYDVGTLRPFLDLPQAVYGGSGFAGEAYRGAGLAGTHEFKNGWGANYDLYAGAMGIEEAATSFDYALEMRLPESPELHESTNEVLGSRLVFRAPINGLSFGGSLYRGSLVEGGANFPRWVGATQFEYLNNTVSLRAEYAHEYSLETGGQTMTVDGGYGELGYRLTSKWQLAARAEQMKTNLPGMDGPAMRDWLNHQEIAGGINFWVTPSFVLKASLHDVTGNRFAVPSLATLSDMMMNHQVPNRHTQLLTIGAQADF